MKLERTEEEMDLGFQTPAAGKYVWIHTDGIDLIENEETGSKNFKFPMMIDSVISGDPNAEGMQIIRFINIVDKNGKENQFGFKQVCNLLTISGKIDTYIDKFGDIEPTSEKFIRRLQLDIPGLMVVAKHEIRTFNEKQNVNFLSIGPYKKTKDVKKVVTKVEEASTASTKSIPDSDGDEW